MRDGAEAGKTPRYGNYFAVRGNDGAAFIAFVVDFVGGHGMNERRRLEDAFTSSKTLIVRRSTHGGN